LTVVLSAYARICHRVRPVPVEATRCLCLAARGASRAITREFDQALRTHGLRASQFTLLAALHLAGLQVSGELAGGPCMVPLPGDHPARRRETQR
jgi:hypothetical protein